VWAWGDRSCLLLKFWQGEKGGVGGGVLAHSCRCSHYKPCIKNLIFQKKWKILRIHLDIFCLHTKFHEKNNIFMTYVKRLKMPHEWLYWSIEFFAFYINHKIYSFPKLWANTSNKPVRCYGKSYLMCIKIFGRVLVPQNSYAVLGKKYCFHKSMSI
jgi:hypothetical protein